MTRGIVHSRCARLFAWREASTARPPTSTSSWQALLNASRLEQPPSTATDTQVARESAPSATPSASSSASSSASTAAPPTTQTATDRPVWPRLAMVASTPATHQGTLACLGSRAGNYQRYFEALQSSLDQLEASLGANVSPTDARLVVLRELADSVAMNPTLRTMQEKCRVVHWAAEFLAGRPIDTVVSSLRDFQQGGAKVLNKNLFKQRQREQRARLASLSTAESDGSASGPAQLTLSPS